jgi:hypothetical protein
MHAGSGRRVGGPTLPAFAYRWPDTGLAAGPVWTNVGGGFVMAKRVAEDDVSIVTWRGKNALLSAGHRLQNDTESLGSSTARTWLFALQIPADAPGFSGVGPTSTSSAVHVNKNFPLYFKDGNVIGSQPATSNRDSPLDMSPYYGLDAIIVVRQQASGIRFSMWIDGVGAVVTTASGEAPAAGQGGMSAGGWHDMGGEYAYPIGHIAQEPVGLSDEAMDAARDLAAIYFTMAGA